MSLSLSLPQRAETRFSPCIVLALFRSSTYRIRLSEVGSMRGAYPFAKIHYMGERLTRSVAVPPHGLVNGLVEHSVWRICRA
jgi:hypothetical protein